ncbi:MAG: riboflavin biosynthesis protein RibF [Candidatus Limnocylindrales bacterium]
MTTVLDIDALPAGLRFVATVGVFDGVHRGHARVISVLAALARQTSATAVAITLEPHPEKVLRGAGPAALSDPAERIERLKALGAGSVVVQRFDQAFAAQSAETFLTRLGLGRHLAGLVMSPESAFGRDRKGTLGRIRTIAAERGFELSEVPPLEMGDERVSSTRIRQAVEAGHLSAAARLLDRRYAVVGTVVHGDGRGRGMGYATANLAFAEPVVLPPNGVFAVRVTWGGQGPLTPAHRRDGVASLGVRPTFEGDGERLLEAHLFDFDGDLYGELLRVEFVRRQRGEKRFGSITSLIRQMDRDAARARIILAVLPDPPSRVGG